MPLHSLFSLYPLVPLCVSFIVGIVVGDCFEEYSSLWYGILFVTVGLIVGSLFFRRSPIVQTILLLCSASLLGCSLTLFYYDRTSINIPLDEEVYEAVIISEPIEKKKIVRFDMTVLTGTLKGHSVRVSLLKDTLTRSYEQLMIGDGIVACSRFTKPKNYYDSNFNYVRYLKGHGIVAQTFIGYDRWETSRVSLKTLSRLERLQLKAQRFRYNIFERYHSAGLEGDAFALASAMAFGDRTALSDDLEDTYAVSGVSHILSLSGLHLSVIYALLCFLTFGRKRHVVRELLLLFAVWAYVLMAGTEPPLVRSALMITVYSIISISGRNPMSLNVLAFAALCMLVVNPLTLYDIGFQLSFLAIGFIMVLHRPVASMLSMSFQRRHRVVKWVWHTVVMSFVAQLGTAPLITYYFGYLPIYFLIANLVAIPATTLILYLSIFILAFSWWPAVNTLLITALTYVVGLLNASMAGIASWPNASIENIQINTFQVYTIYFTIVCGCLCVYKMSIYNSQRSGNRLWH